MLPTLLLCIFCRLLEMGATVRIHVMPVFVFVNENMEVGRTLPDLSICLHGDIVIPTPDLSITNGDDFQNFRTQAINETCWTLVLQRPLDADQMNSDGSRGQTFSLALRCSLEGGRQSYANLDIQVVDINDNKPRFIDTDTAVSIEEDHITSNPIFTVSTFDPDTGVGGIVSFKMMDTFGSTFELRNGSCSDSKCDATVYLMKKLDYDLRNIYTLLIEAFDGAGRIPRVNKAQFKVVVNVIDMQNKAPKFTTESRILHVKEDAKIGENILHIQAIDGDTGVVDPHRILYRINGPTHYLDIEEDTGWVYVKNNLDREQPQLLTNNGAITLEIIAEEDSSMIPRPQSHLQLTIVVEDVDDEAPRCNLSQYSAQVSETAHRLIPITLLNTNDLYVYDKDTGANGEFGVSLEGPGSDWFEVTPDVVFQEANLIIRVKQPQLLDFESLQSIQLKVLLTPRGFSRQSAQSCDLLIQIQNANDNGPQFNQTEFYAAVRENQPAGTHITQISAWDADSPDFLPILFSLLGPGAEKFTIDSTGKVTTEMSLDRESKPAYHLTVQAADNSGAGHRVTAPLHIKIEDTNDNSPEFLKDSMVAFLEENSIKFTQLPGGFFVQASDLDEGENGNLTYYLDHSVPEASNFSIDPFSGRLSVKPPGLDRELLNHDHINLTVVAKDNGSPRQFTAKGKIIVYVNDSNDNAPQFLSSVYEARIPEMANAGEVVTQVSALDADRGVYNSRLAFRIADVQDKFLIDSQSGIISVADGANLDRDGSGGLSIHRLRVIAVDMGFPQQSGEALVIVHIDDENDTPPVFLSDLVEIAVPENAAIYTSLVNLTATDSDSDAKLKYSIHGYINPVNDQSRVVDVETYNYTTLFGIRANTGEVYTMQELDREQMHQITLLIQVQDVNSKKTQVDSSRVVITIQDVNDNMPQFSRRSYSKTMAENSEIGTVILSVQATDKDVNRTIIYRLEDDSHQVLSIDSVTGELTIIGQVDYERVQWLNLTVVATDNGVPSRSSRVAVNIAIADQNDNSPIFSPTPAYSISLSENVPIGSQVLKVNASDRDSGSFGRVSYFLLNELGTSEPSFVIDRNTGALVVNRALDRETKAKYQLSVQAVDDYTGHINPDSHEATAIVEIALTDVNDNPPEFNHNSIRKLSISESDSVGEIVGKLIATDADEDVNGHATVNYFIIGGNATLPSGKPLFSVDPQNGELRISGEVRGMFGKYVITVQARDKGRPPLSSNTTVSVSVRDHNDHNPVIKQPTRQAVYPVNENNHTQYTAVLVISAEDGDFAENAEIRYKLKPTTTNENWKYFSVDAISGEVFLKQPLDYEKQRRYDLTAQACDKGRPPLCDEVEFAVLVRDLDDNCPFFKRSLNYTHFVTIVENEMDAITSGNIMDAIDADTETNNTRVCYQIVMTTPKTAPFRLVSESLLKLQVTSPLDRETHDSYMVVVRVTDCHQNAVCSKGANIAIGNTSPTAYSPGDTSLLLVKINVLDKNDNAPKFTQSLFGGGVIYDTKIGTRVTKLRATDLDKDDVISYHLIGEPVAHMGNGARVDTRRRPFLVNSTTGDVTTNILFQPEWKGSFTFKVMVNDSINHRDTGEVNIHLLSIDQQIELVFEKPVNQVWEQADHIIRHLSLITESNATIDDVRTMETRDRNINLSKLMAHFIKPDKSIMNVEDALRSLDLPKTSNQRLSKQRLISRHGLRYAGQNPESTESTTGLESIYMAMAGSIIGLILILLILMVGWCVQNRRYRRKLKAATTLAFGSTETTVPNYDVPGTNLHSGSNPVWRGVGVENYGMDYERQSDVCSGNSLDENDVDNGKSDVHFFGGDNDRSLPRSNVYSMQADEALRARFKNPAPFPPGHRSSLPRTNGTLMNGVSHMPNGHGHIGHMNGGSHDRTISPQPNYPQPIMASLESTEL